MSHRSTLSRLAAALGVAFAGMTSTAAAFNVTNPGGRLACGRDFFAIEANDTLDYSNPSDRRRGGLDDTGLTSTSVSGGQYNFTTGSDPQVWYWYPGVIGAYSEPETGASIPIDASTYRTLSMKITCASCPDPVDAPGGPGGCVQGNVQWYNGPAATANNTTTASFCLFNGTNIYQFDLPSMSLVSSNGGTWTGSRTGVRLTPANQSGRSMTVDWVMLSAPSSATATVNSTVAYNKIQLRADNSGVPGARLRLRHRHRFPCWRAQCASGA